MSLQHLLADLHSPAAQELLCRLHLYVLQRVEHGGYRDLVSTSEREEVAGDVMLMLLSGGLERFRGQQVGQLFAYARSITHYTLKDRARRKMKERRLEELRPEPLPSPEEGLQDCPRLLLSENDQRWLIEVLAAGSLAEHARRRGVSRAAVTLKAQRIGRAAAGEKEEVKLWLHNQAERMVA